MVDSQWADNKKELNRKMRKFGTELSETSRLFQRVIIKGSDKDLLKLKKILKETNAKIIELLNKKVE